MKGQNIKKSAKAFMSRELSRIVLSAVLLAVVFLITKLVVMPAKWLTPVLYLIPYLFVGLGTVSEAIEKLFHGELLDEDFLMTVASIGALCIGEYPEAVAVMLFYRIGEYFEHIAIGKSRRSIKELMDIRPEYACVESHGELIRIDPRSLRVGTVITVSPGERIPLDGVIVDGESTVDTSALTGESMPRSAREGAQVFSGCINLSGVIKVRVTSLYRDSTVSKILKLVESSEKSKSHRESRITTFARVYTPVVVILALLIAIVPPMISGELTEWIRRALIFLVISCPCALVISVPLSYFGGIGCASRHGILIKGSEFIEALAEVRTVVMDKTGTVTEGSFSVSAVEPVGIAARELLMLAAAAESFSSHPIAVSLRNACDTLPDPSLVTKVRELAGRGVEATVCGRRVLVGNSALMLENGINCKTPPQLATAVHVAAGGVYGGYIIIDDRIKSGAKQAVSELYELGVEKTVMLTGDTEDNAYTAARALRVTNVYAELMPADKVIAMRELIAEKHSGSLAFVGDGINDAPVLAGADIGVAMGVLGADAALEAADVVLMDDDLRKLPLAMRISKRTVKIAKQNIRMSIGVKLAVLLLAAFGIANMWLAVFADVGVLIIAVLNALTTFRM